MKKNGKKRSTTAPPPPTRQWGAAVRLFLGAASVLLALTVWQIVAWRIAEPILLPTPLSVLRRLFTVFRDKALLSAVLFTLSRIARGFLLGLAVGTLLALPAAFSETFEILLRPWFFTVKAVPVASFVVLAIFWVGGGQLSALISFLMVAPIVYHNLLEGLRHTDRHMLEMAEVFHLSLARRLVYVYVPSLKPHILSACRISLGLAWKAGIAAEMIGIPDGSIGEKLYLTKVWMDTEGLLAFTLLIVLVSLLTEKAVMLLLRLAFRLWETLPDRLGKKEKKHTQTIAHLPTALTLSKINKHFGDRTVLNGLSLYLPAHSVTGLMGPSGCGKTTLFRILLGLEVPDNEEARLNGIPSRIGCQFQENRLCENFSVRANLRLAKKNISDEEIGAHLAAVGLQGELYTPVRSLSGGMRRRVSLVRAMLTDAPVLLLDEPFGGLDDKARADAAAYILRYRKNRTLLFITHEASDVEHLSANLVLFEDITHVA